MTVVETKRKLDGRLLHFNCEGLEVAPARAIIRLRLEHGVSLADLRIPAGTTSYGIFWAHRPYNVYLWVDPAGTTLGAYCNVAAETRIEAGAVDWLDLEADVLATPDGRTQVLDLDEVPADLSPPHRAALEAALAALKDGPAVLAEAEAATAAFRQP